MLGVCYCGAYGGGKHTFSARCKPTPPAVVTDLQRLDSRLSDAAYRLKKANEELHRADETGAVGSAVAATVGAGNALRAAFAATLTDPEFIEDARRMALDVNPVSGRAVEALIEDLYTTPDDVVAKVRRVTTFQ